MSCLFSNIGSLTLEQLTRAKCARTCAALLNGITPEMPAHVMANVTFLEDHLDVDVCCCCNCLQVYKYIIKYTFVNDIVVAIAKCTIIHNYTFVK